MPQTNTTETAIRTVTLACTEGGADKVYILNLFQLNNGFNGYKVIGYNGPRGGTLTPQIKTASPVTLETATKIFDTVVKEKLNPRKGYKVVTDAAPIASGTATKNPPPFSPENIARVERNNPDYQPMLLNSITDPEPYLKSKDWLLQRKEDGVRAIAVVGDSVETFSRSELPVSITAACAKILCAVFDGCVLDLEVMGERIAVLDILAGGAAKTPNNIGVDLRDYSCLDRLRALRSLSGKLLKATGPVQLVETATSTLGKLELLDKLRADGSEGAVFKMTAAPYRAGRQDCALKLKFKARATLRVVAIGTKGKASVDVADADGRVVASASTIGRPVPAIGALVEIEYLYAHRNGKLTQPVYITIREDKDRADGDESFQYKGEKR